MKKQRKQPEDRIIVWRSAHGWRWKAVAKNHECVATCAGQHYNRRAECLKRAHMYGPHGWPIIIRDAKRRAAK